jgi:hypothetical protein
MKKNTVFIYATLTMVCFVVSVNAADLRYKANGPWQDVEGVGGITGHGWQGGALPGAADTARANWGGWAGNKITLDYAAPTITRFQLGVDESGTLEVNSGGSITATGNSVVGNNNWVTGKLIINTGGLVINNGWFGVGRGNGGTKTAGWDPLNPTATYGATYGVVEINGGTLDIKSHLWAATGGTHASSGGAPTSFATININAGGVILVGGNIGLGTGDASTPAAGGGKATLNVNQGGLLNLHHWDDTKSIQAGSVLNISGTGKVVIGGNRVTAANNYFTAGKIKAYGGAGTISAVYNSGTDKTTITAVSRMQPSPANGSMIGEGTVALSWTNMDPNKPGDPVYVDVWYGTDPTWIPEPNELLPGYPGHYVDFNKVVSGQNTTTIAVAAPVVGTAPTKYYWRVDSYIFGSPTGTPVQGDVFEFAVTDDFPPTVVIDTPNTITWGNQPVQLNATVSDSGDSALTITWTATDPGAVFTPSANVEDPVVTINPAAFPATVTLTCSVKDAFNPQTNTDTVDLVVYADSCQAARQGAGRAAVYPMDMAAPYCVIDIADLAVMALDWLTDYALTGPTVIP